MKSIKEKIKSKVKAKAQALKEKLKGAKPCKPRKRHAAIVAAIGLAVALSGCATADPASRSNDNTIGDVEPTVKVTLENANSNTVSVVLKVTFGDGVIASADSKGSTETQTATPTTSIPVQIDARYNDALAAASTTSRGVVDSLATAGKNAVLELLAAKATGSVTVPLKDGTMATVDCKGGQCSFANGSCGSGACSERSAKKK